MKGENLVQNAKSLHSLYAYLSCASIKPELSDSFQENGPDKSSGSK